MIPPEPLFADDDTLRAIDAAAAASASASPVPPIVIDERRADGFSGRVRFGRATLGGNGAVHGGSLGLIFDELLGNTASIGDLGPDGVAVIHEEPILVRVHSECLTGDVFGSMRCDCGPQLATAMKMIEEEGKGALVYLRQEGRGIGLINKLHAYKLQEQGLDTVEANERLGLPVDKRDYGIGSQILRDLGIRQIRIMTNNPKKIHGLEGYGLSIVENVPVKIEPGEHNTRYLETKRLKLGHRL